MNKNVVIYYCFLAVLVINAYPQEMKHYAHNQKNNISAVTNPNKADLTEEPKKVLMHYMGWFGSGISGEYWVCGQPRTPLIGYYNSHSRATQLYHILLSWSCGIDGVVINVKDTYDSISLNLLISLLNSVRDIDSTTFKYDFAVSIDDQGMDKEGIDTAITAFTYLRDSIILRNRYYLKYNGNAVIFIWNYKTNIAYNIPDYLTVAEYKTVIDSVFSENRPLIIWNEIEAPEIANSYYAWVQGASSDGTDWGRNYLNWYYPTLANALPQHPNLKFAIGGVWAGFDTRINKCWGEKVWTDRQNGAVYDSTWNYVNKYSILYPATPVPLKWVYIETWNDWNEGTEIEPSKEFGYKYLLSTIKNINAFKGTNISMDTCKFSAAKKIYEAAHLIELNQRDSATYYPILKSAIKNFILNQFDSSVCKTTCIIENVTDCCKESNITERKNLGIEIYPNPANDKLYIRLMDNNPGIVQLINIQGEIVLSYELKSRFEIINLSNIARGLYLIRVNQNNIMFEEKVLVR